MLIPKTYFTAFKTSIQTSLGKFCQQSTFEEQESATKVLKTKEREKKKEYFLVVLTKSSYTTDRQKKETNFH